MAVFQRLERVTHVMAHTSPTSSPDMRNIWQYKKNNSPREKWGCSWSILCYSCFPGPGIGFGETKHKLGLSKPEPGARRKHSLTHSLRNTKGGSESLFSSISVLSTSFGIETISYPTLTAKQIAWRLSSVCVWDLKALTDRWKLTLHTSMGNTMAERVFRMDNMYGEYLIFVLFF